MYVIEKMRLNRFERKPIISARALVASRGMSESIIKSQCGSDCFDSPNIDGASKTKLLGLVDEMARSAYAKHISDGNSPDMKPKDAKDL